MIIRMTLGENDFIQELEDFCTGLRDRMFVIDENEAPKKENYDSVESYCQAILDHLDRIDAMKEIRSRLLDTRKKFKKGSSEYEQICGEVLRLWSIYAKTVDMSRWTPSVSIQYELKEKWENDEVVYYFSCRDRFISQ